MQQPLPGAGDCIRSRVPLRRPLPGRWHGVIAQVQTARAVRVVGDGCATAFQAVRPRLQAPATTKSVSPATVFWLDRIVCYAGVGSGKSFVDAARQETPPRSVVDRDRLAVGGTVCTGVPGSCDRGLSPALDPARSTRATDPLALLVWRWVHRGTGSATSRRLWDWLFGNPAAEAY